MGILSVNGDLNFPPFLVEFVPPMRPHEICALAKELFLVGGNTLLMPIYHWDKKWIGEQFVCAYSDLFRVLYTLIRQDMIYSGYDSSLLTPIPYSILTSSEGKQT